MLYICKLKLKQKQEQEKKEVKTQDIIYLFPLKGKQIAWENRIVIQVINDILILGLHIKLVNVHLIINQSNKIKI